MTRLMVFLSILAGFILLLVLYTFKTFPVSNEKFDIFITETAYKAHTEKVLEENTQKEPEGTVVLVELEYAPEVDLSTPQLTA